MALGVSLSALLMFVRTVHEDQHGPTGTFVSYTTSVHIRVIPVAPDRFTMRVSRLKLTRTRRGGGKPRMDLRAFDLAGPLLP